MIRALFPGFIRAHILFPAAQGPGDGTAPMAELARHGYRIGSGTLYPIRHGVAKPDATTVRLGGQRTRQIFLANPPQVVVCSVSTRGPT